MQRVFDRIQPRYVVVAILLVQGIWLAAIWYTGAARNTDKLLPLGIYTLASGVFACSLSSERLASFRQGILNHRSALVVVAACAMTWLAYLYAENQRTWTWDEEQNFTASKIFADDGVSAYFDSYAENPWLGRQHPPLVPLLNGLVMRIFGTNILVMRMLSVVFGAGTISCTYLLGRELYDPAIGILSACFLLTFPLMIRLGTAALTDVQVTFFFVSALVLTLRLSRNASFGQAALLGMSIGAGLLTKYTMVFIFPLFLMLILVDKRFRALVPYLAVSVIIAVSILGAWLLYASRIGVLVGQSEVVDISPGWHVVNRDGLTFLVNSLFTRLPSAIGVYNTPFILLGALLVTVQRAGSDRFVLVWVATITILLLVSIPDHRYFMPTFPALSIMMALWLRSSKKPMDRAVVLSILCAIGTLWLFIDWQRIAVITVN